MRDFTISTYNYFLENLIKQGYNFFSFKDFLTQNAGGSKDKLIILRHDVDKLPNNSLVTAHIEHSSGIHGSYYFRIVSQSFDEDIIKGIASLGHEIGYHYETMDTYRGDVDKAYDEFCRNLEKFRKIVDVKTICMHGSPRSKYDNRAIWKKYDYRKLGIIGEPYFDIDFNKVAYFTDTGRRWNGDKFSVRDKVDSPFNFNFKSTQDIIDNIEKLPDQIMLTIHPQRWTDKPIPWCKELVLQNIKNVVKYFIVRK